LATGDKGRCRGACRVDPASSKRSLPRIPPEPLDAPDDPRKYALSQLALGHWLSGMSDEASGGPEQAPLQARESPALDGDGQDQSAQLP
jgi:hypothetical protein